MQSRLAKKIRKSSRKLNRLYVKAILAGKDSTATALAGAIGISVPYLHDILTGKRNAERYIAKIAAVLGVSERSIVLRDVDVGHGTTRLKAESEPQQAG
jgi:transcriptional regulator with XRE-family HTH domain